VQEEKKTEDKKEEKKTEYKKDNISERKKEEISDKFKKEFASLCQSKSKYVVVDENKFRLLWEKCSPFERDYLLDNCESEFAAVWRNSSAVERNEILQKQVKKAAWNQMLTRD
jgi:hypothetical protein